MSIDADMDSMDKMSQSFTCTARVYFDQFDKLHVLHNAQYVLLFERARWEFWEMLGLAPETEDADWPYLVAKNTINYRKAIREPQTVTIEMGVRDIRMSSLTIHQRLHDKHGALCAESEIVLVRVDAETGKPIAWSQTVRTLLQPFNRALAGA